MDPKPRPKTESMAISSFFFFAKGPKVSPGLPPVVPKSMLGCFNLRDPNLFWDCVPWFLEWCSRKPQVAPRGLPSLCQEHQLEVQLAKDREALPRRIPRLLPFDSI